MVRIENPDDYVLKGFEKSTHKNKKYNALLQHKNTDKIVKVPFGDTRYGQFRDQTPLKLYSDRDHNDLKRRQNYLARHAKDKDYKFSSGFFSSTFLW